MVDYDKIFESAQEKIKNQGKREYKPLEKGKYIVKLDNVELSDNFGSPCVLVVLKIDNGEFKNRLEFVRYDLVCEGLDEIKGKEVQEFIIEKNVEKIMAISNAVGADVNIEDIKEEDPTRKHERIAFKLNNKKGSLLQMELWFRENKKKPEFPHHEHNFTPYTAQDILLEQATVINDDDMPF